MGRSIRIRCVLILLATTAGAIPAAGQSLEGIRVYDEQLRVQLDKQKVRESGFDAGGWFNFAYMYYNDIGAEGKLRDISTQLDEICSRKDVLVHFLRKQSHVESSNRIIGFMEAVISFWDTKEKTNLEPYVPPTIFQQIDTQGPYIDGVHRVVRHLKKKGISIPGGLLSMKQSEQALLLDDITGVSGRDIERALLTVAFYKLLNQKYNIEFFEMDQLVGQLRTDIFPDLKLLKKAFSEERLKDKLSGMLAYLERLRELTLSSKTYDIREDIYKKRHFTVDIPSMYGSYREVKFDTLGLTLHRRYTSDACKDAE